MEAKTVDWLLDGPPWMRFAAETQLLGRRADPSPALADPAIRAVAARLRDPVVGIPSLESGKALYLRAGTVFWDLFFLSDIGLTAEDLGLEKEIGSILASQRTDGAFVFQEGTKPGYFCIQAIILASLAKMGFREDPRMLRFVERVFETQRLDGGWHCAIDRAKGKRLEDSESCPMDVLNVLMLLGQYEAFRTDERLHGAQDLLLSHWRRREEPWRPYGFGIGHDFVKLRYPAMKYGILRVLDVLSLYPHATGSDGYRDMLGTVASKAVEGRFSAESVARSYADLDFGQTREPSRWMTFLVERIRSRAPDAR